MFQNEPVKLVSARRLDYDVVDEVQVGDGEIAVREMVRIFAEIYPQHQHLSEVILRHGDLITRMYTGTHSDYRLCDSLYHDLQHTMDVSLCMARVLYGYEALAPSENRLGPELFAIGILAALYHDSGYILHKQKDRDILSCASVTASHVGRGGELMKERLRDVSAFTDLIDDAANILHYTGYEQKIEGVLLKTPALHIVGKILGSADLMAQASDRCYLEKCRDRLFPEFVLGGFDYSIDGTQIYESARMLMVKTPIFYRSTLRRRLEENLSSYYHYSGIIFGGINHYCLWMENNIRYLQLLIDKNKLDKLRRQLPKTYGEDKFPYEKMAAIMKENKESWSLKRMAHSRAGLSG